MIRDDGPHLATHLLALDIADKAMEIYSYVYTLGLVDVQYLQMASSLRGNKMSLKLHRFPRAI